MARLRGVTEMKINRPSFRNSLASRASVIALLATAGAVGNVGHVKASCDALYVSSGTITGSHDCAIARFVIGDVINDGTIGPTEDGEAGFFVGKGGIDGQLLNRGTIMGGGYYGGEGYEMYEEYGGEGDEGEGPQGALTITTNISGGVRNEGLISSESGSAIQLGSLGGCYYNVLPAGMTGDITNAGTIESFYDDGFKALYGWMDGAFVNEAGGVVRGYRGIYVSSDFGSWSGGISNNGTIDGQSSAIQIGDDDTECVECVVLALNEGPNPYFEGKGDVVFSGGIYNGSLGKYVGRTNAALNIHGQSFSGGITNHGVITQILPEEGYYENDGYGVGILIGADSFSGGITNSGRIDGLAGPAIWIRDDVYSFTGGIQNTGTIQSVAVAIDIDAYSFSGGLSNDGTIRGGNEHAAVYIHGDTFSDGMTNSGLIEGGLAGVVIDVESFYGDIINDGTVSGGVTTDGIIPVEDPGYSITSTTHIGNITNNGTLDANSDALLLDIDNLSGSITNNGLIEAHTFGTRAVNLDIGNGASFTNSNNALIRGDVLFGGKNASYQFNAVSGGVEGDLLGVDNFFDEVNDDTITVTGEHYFVSHGGEGAGYAENFASFDVESGGVAIMGSTSVGSSGGEGYNLYNVDALNLYAGGHLYIDNQSTLNVGSFTQAGSSLLSFYLTEPPTAEGTPGVDFGQIVASGDVHLAGTIQAVVDPLAFAGTGLTEYVYEDVIAGGSLTGDFVEDLVSGGSGFYTLRHELDDDNTVDLYLTRNPFTSVSCSDNGNRLAALLEQMFQGGNLTPEEQALLTFLLQLPEGEICGAFDDVGGTRQADLGSIVVETAGPWKSLVNDRVNGLGAVGCSLASTSGSCFNRFAANETGATQVMTDATPGQDPFDWLRTGTRRVGDTASWGRLVGVWGGTDSEPGVGGMDFALTGGIVGVDHVFAEDILAGVAMQYTTDDLSFSGSADDADIDSFEVGAYASFGDTRLYLNMNASFIWHEFNVQRIINLGGAFAKYDGTTLSAYMELGKIFETEDMRIQPVLALSFADLDTDAYQETGFAFSKLNVDAAEFTTLKSMIGSRFAFPIDLESGRKMIPEARVVWTHEFADNQSSFLAALQSDPGNKFLVEGREYARDSLVLGAGVTAPVSSDASLTFDYDASINPDITTHTLSAGVRVKW